MERYRRDLEVPPSLASVVQVALKRYLEERGYPVKDGGVFEDEEELILPTGPKPRGLVDAPRPRDGGNPVSDAVIEDRR
ncbi:MAG TPA: hypothetical protein VFQ09_00505 [Rubrobacter sp.]|nr:hypothetical protein [Rubrobacter sp.]